MRIDLSYGVRTRGNLSQETRVVCNSCKKQVSRWGLASHSPSFHKGRTSNENKTKLCGHSQCSTLVSN